MYKVGKYFKIQESKSICLDLHRKAQNAFDAFCEAAKITVHRCSCGCRCGYVHGKDIAKVEILEDMEALEAWHVKYKAKQARIAKRKR